MPVYKLTIEYNGTPFGGWQIQNNNITVQGEIQKALAVILKSPHKIQGASRTDAGVHAIGQVAHLKTSVDISTHKLARGISALCRPSISIVKAEIIHDRFNARFDSLGKHYRYTVLNRSASSPLLSNTSWHVSHKIDLNRMLNAAKMVEGEHDFAGFRASDCERDSTIRYISSVNIVQIPGDIVEIHVKGTAFLKNMVRIIAGTLVDIAIGKLPENTIESLFLNPNRIFAGRTAPANGLALLKVYY